MDNLENIVLISNKNFNIKDIKSYIFNLAKLDEQTMEILYNLYHRVSVPSNLIENIQYSASKDFKTTNATMTFELNG